MPRRFRIQPAVGRISCLAELGVLSYNVHRPVEIRRGENPGGSQRPAIQTFWEYHVKMPNARRVRRGLPRAQHTVVGAPFQECEISVARDNCLTRQAMPASSGVYLIARSVVTSKGIFSSCVSSKTSR